MNHESMSKNPDAGGNAILRLCAYLIRQASCVDEDQPVVLSAVPEVLRKMALAARDEMDEMRNKPKQGSLFAPPSSKPKRPSPTMPPYSNPTTSRAAADSVRESAGTLRAKVLQFIRDCGGATCDEAEEALGLTHQTASARVNELMRRGQIEDSGNTKPTRSGRKAIVWKAAEGRL